MESRADSFRAKATDAFKEAERTTDPAAKALFIDLARRWHELAEQTERIDREGPKP